MLEDTMKLNISPTPCTLPQLTASLLAQQQQFFCANKIQENVTIVSYKVAQLIAWHGKPFSDGDFIKECLTKVIVMKMQEFENVSMSRKTVARRVKDPSANFKHLKVSGKASALVDS